MPDVRFEQPDLLWTLAVIPLTVVAYLLFEAHRRRVAGRFASPHLQAGVTAGAARWRRHVPVALYLLAVAALALGAGRPVVLTAEQQRSTTVILAIDASRSMQNPEGEGTRLEAARAAAGSFLASAPAFVRVGIAAFSTTVELMSAPTTDRAASGEALGRIATGAEPGTAIGDAVDRSLTFLAGRDVGAVILLSDGRNTAGAVAPLEAAHRARSAGIPVFTVAVGSAAAAAEGAASPADTELLATIAETSGGVAYETRSADELQDVYRRLGADVFVRVRTSDVTWIFLAAAGVCLMVGAGLAAGWLRRVP